MGYIARAAIVVFGIWALAQALWMARDFVFVLFLATLLGAFLSIFVDRLQRIHVPRALGGPLVLLASFGVFVGLGWAAWPTLRDQFGELRREFPRALDNAVIWAHEQYAQITGEIGNGRRDLQSDIQAQVGDVASRLASGLMPVLTTIGGALTGFLVVIFAGLYLTIEQRLFRNNTIRLVPPTGRERAAETLERVGHTLRGWMLGTVINMILVGTLTALSLWALGIPTAFALGIIAGVLEFVPVFGPIIASIPGIAIALVISPTMALWVTLLYVAIQQVESNLINPLVMKGVIKLPPALSLAFQVVMSVLFGFIGLLVAVPVLAALIVAVKSLYIEPMEQAAERHGISPEVPGAESEGGRLPSDDDRESDSDRPSRRQS